MTSDIRDTVTIAIPKELALELAKYADCYAPVLREVAKACVSSLKQNDD